MSNTKALEASMMYDLIKNIKNPRDVLINLSKLEPEIGWNNSKEIRFLAYGVWLSKNNEEWYDYLVASNNAIKIIKLGGTPFDIPDEPKGWINPLPYINGDKHD